MNKLTKILLWLVGSVVGLLLIVSLAAYLFFPLDEVKKMAIEKGYIRAMEYIQDNNNKDVPELVADVVPRGKFSIQSGEYY